MQMTSFNPTFFILRANILENQFVHDVGFNHNRGQAKVHDEYHTILFLKVRNFQRGCNGANERNIIHVPGIYLAIIE